VQGLDWQALFNRSADAPHPIDLRLREIEQLALPAPALIDPEGGAVSMDANGIARRTQEGTEP
jgi:hypothetical protein